MKKVYFLVLNLVIMSSFIGCDKGTDVIPQEKGNLTIEMQHYFDDEPLLLNVGQYKTFSGEDVSFSTFNYYISNITLKNTKGETYTYPQDSSYFLIRSHTPSTKTFTLKNLPKTDYTEMSFWVGVDSARTCGDMSNLIGVLDPVNSDGMVWDWNTGYIFMKLEGFCPQIDTTNSINFRYHIAGFGGCDPASPTVNNLKKITIPFTSSVAIQKTTTPEVHIKVDASKIFNGVTPWEVSKHTNVMSLNKESQTISDNYATMFSLKEIH